MTLPVILPTLNCLRLFLLCASELMAFLNESRQTTSILKGVVLREGGYVVRVASREKSCQFSEFLKREKKVCHIFVFYPMKTLHTH